LGADFLRLLSIVLLILAVTKPAGGRQLCLNCHPAHYAGRGDCSSCHRGNPASDRKNIAHDSLITGPYASFTLGETAPGRAGQRLIKQYACLRCHVISGQGNRLATSLDLAANRKAPPELAKAIMLPSEGMPDFRLNEQGKIAIINALLAAGQKHRPENPTQPQIVHFSSTVDSGHDLFSKKCGPCHRFLSQRYGALGKGNIGPNLSGLLSPFYPRSFRNNEPWTEARLRGWLQNPRRIRPWALMQPVILTRAELAELVSIVKMNFQSAP
jgi:cytochrome c2